MKTFDIRISESIRLLLVEALSRVNRDDLPEELAKLHIGATHALADLEALEEQQPAYVLVDIHHEADPGYDLEPEEIKDAVFNGLDVSKEAGYFKEGQRLHGATPEAIATDLNEWWTEDEVRPVIAVHRQLPHIIEWLKANT